MRLARPHRLSVRTSGFHPGKSGSTPGGATKKKTGIFVRVFSVQESNPERGRENICFPVAEKPKPRGFGILRKQYWVGTPGGATKESLIFSRKKFFNFLYKIMTDPRHEMFKGREEAVKRKMEKNTEVESLTKEQHSALAELAALRHDVHVNSWMITGSDTTNFLPYKDGLIGINKILKSSGLPIIEELGQRYGQIIAAYHKSYDIHERKKMDDFQRLRAEFLSWFNNSVKSYLKKIDQEYGTKYCPVGWRIKEL